MSAVYESAFVGGFGGLMGAGLTYPAYLSFLADLRRVARAGGMIDLNEPRTRALLKRACVDSLTAKQTELSCMGYSKTELRRARLDGEIEDLRAIHRELEAMT